MRWVGKAVLQQGLSYAPGGERLNYLLQRKLFRSLPAGKASFEQKAERARQHFEAFTQHSQVPPGDARFYEFGAGWDLLVPLTYYQLGVRDQTLVDIRPLVRLDLVEDTLRRLGLEGDPARLERFGISYLAPRDARATGLPAASFDFVSSTDTAEHIPPGDLAKILRECRRLLKPDGLLSFRADLEDHYSRFDRSVSRYNFLRYSDRTWALLNPPLHYQNRLRAPDYSRLVREAGFRIVDERLSRPNERDERELAAVPLAPRFRGYAKEELGVRGITIVASPDAA